jgi:hypothetical protein
MFYLRLMMKSCGTRCSSLIVCTGGLIPSRFWILSLIAKTDNPIAVLSGLLKVDKDGMPTGDVQPLACPSAWSRLRLINSVLLASIADRDDPSLGSWFLTRQVVNVRQYGVGVQDGLQVAQCIHSIRLYLAREACAAQQDPANPYCALITASDISNAFKESTNSTVTPFFKCSF